MSGSSSRLKVHTFTYSIRKVWFSWMLGCWHHFLSVDVLPAALKSLRADWYSYHLRMSYRHTYCILLIQFDAIVAHLEYSHFWKVAFYAVPAVAASELLHPKCLRIGYVEVKTQLLRSKLQEFWPAEKSVNWCCRTVERRVCVDDRWKVYETNWKPQIDRHTLDFKLRCTTGINKLSKLLDMLPKCSFSRTICQEKTCPKPGIWTRLQRKMLCGFKSRSSFCMLLLDWMILRCCEMMWEFKRFQKPHPKRVTRFETENSTCAALRQQVEDHGEGREMNQKQVEAPEQETQTQSRNVGRHSDFRLRSHWSQEERSVRGEKYAGCGKL